MTDVRLTAVNPEDSQVYPVACNDKGELLLDPGTSPSGDLDVPGNLTVAGATVVGSSPLSGAANGVRLGPGGTVSTSAVSTCFEGYTTGNSSATSTINADGSVSFKGNSSVGSFDLSNANTSGVRVNASGSIQIQRDSAASSSPRFEIIRGTNDTTAALNSDGSASFMAGSVTVNSSSSLGRLQVNRSSAGKAFVVNNNTSDTVTILGDGSASFISNIDAAYFRGDATAFNNIVFRGMLNGSPTSNVYGDGSANFAGNVTAPNINFKLAPATVAAMPAPLIDEGFASNNEVDLLSVIMEMKLQIRDLNAFMQRSIQDDPET